MKTETNSKYSFEIVKTVRYAREIEKRSIKWIAERYDIPVDTIRDWLYRGRRLRRNGRRLGRRTACCRAVVVYGVFR